MKLTTVSSVGLGLAIAGWLSGAYGVFSQLGDSAMSLTHAELETHRRVAISYVLVGLVALVTSIWLSGYTFKVAPRRAALALLGCVVPAMVLIAAAFS